MVAVVVRYEYGVYFRRVEMRFVATGEKVSLAYAAVNEDAVSGLVVFDDGRVTSASACEYVEFEHAAPVLFRFGLLRSIIRCFRVVSSGALPIRYYCFETNKMRHKGKRGVVEEQKTVEAADEKKGLDSSEHKKPGMKDRMALPVPNVIKLAKESGGSALGSWVGLVLMVLVVAALLVGLPAVLPVPSGMDLPHQGFAHIVAFAIAAFVGIVYVRVRERRSERSMGFARNDGAALCVVGAVAGVVGLMVVFALFKGAGIVGDFTIHSQVSVIALALSFAGYVILALGQEVFCRGYVLTSFSARYSTAVGMVVQTAVFALFHVLVMGPSVFSIVNGVLMGAMFGLMFLKFGSIWPAIGFHSLWYFVQYIILGMTPGAQVSSYATIMVTTYDSSNALLSGGVAGFEASALAAVVYAAAIACLLVLKPRDADVDSIAFVDLGETVVVGSEEESVEKEDRE